VSPLRRSLLVLIPALAILGACGGGDDDSDEGAGDASPGDESGSGASASPTRGGGDSGGSSSKDAVFQAIKDGAFGEGKLHIEISGDKDLEFDAAGNGLATGGYTLLTFASDKASVLLAFQADSKEAPGAFTLTTEEFATAGEWGTQCTVTTDDGADELKGEFECKELEAVDVRAVKTYKVRIKGSFSVPR
jgi:hypothetical protein